MPSSLVYGFLDESSSLPSKDLFFCVDIVVSDEKVSKLLSDILTRARKRIIKKKLKTLTEIKFYHSDERTRSYILSQIATTDVEIVVLIVDKKGRKVADTPENYGIVVGVAIAEVLKLHPRLELTVDKKFTNPDQQENFIRESEKTAIKLTQKGMSLIFNTPADSKRNRQVQLADFVAGAFNSKYNKNDNHYFEIIKEKIKTEKVVNWSDIKKRMVKP